MADKHDRVFKDLISNRDFAICFLMTYLPKELIALVDWHSVKLESANVEHVRQQQKDNKKQKEQSDLTFLFKFKDGKNGAVFVHIESQTGDDGTIVIRTRHYQTSYLLDYIKRHKTAKDLPLVVSIIYYANKKPFSHSLNINDYFANTELAKKYAFTTQFIDLNRYSDEEILEHGFIAGYELILKAIREKNIDGKLDIAINQIEAYDHIARQVLIRYMSQYSDMETDAFYDRIIDSKPDLRGDVMTVAEQWKQQGMQQGRFLEKQETARNLFGMSLSVDQVANATGLDLDTVLKLKKEVDSKTQH
ncbi:Rpn family recombination-promoting nuclease/putative transposase [Cysteiniphilum sp. QT6929]|uniref:Rpn family recombination-promoting nuclease/putative transposase n=1 Tax=Cysteiniphilum sp. QT6929 TaxID=2975055 RepID=UPI0024B3AAA6|nr:Rpn family recombination-promoting nuclease/putative transposase [Cysteiniphilum sp. QT6929]WHN66779.1 Rpn family recombination-promoting nuclease/putative transposase [Cysteiniphilum sp. QT6929]